MKKIKALLTRFFSSAIAPLFVVGISSIAMAHAQSQPLPQPITDQTDLQNFMCSIAGWFFWIVLVISVIMLLYAAFQYVTARDDVEKTSRARRTITYAAIGIAVALIAGGFPTLIASVFPNNPDVPKTCF